jgi:hypothetical protein
MAGDILRVIQIVFVLAIAFIPSVGFSQFNDTTHYYINYASTGSINKTNDGTSYLLNNNLRFSINKKTVSFNTTNSWIYGKQLGNLTNDDIYSGLDFNLYKRLQNFYYWGLANYEKSYSLKINHRLQTGAGLGYNVVNRKNVLVILSDGILYEKGDLYDSPEEGNNQYEVFRNSFRLKFRMIIKKVIVIEGYDFLQHALSDRKDYIIKSNTSLSVKLRKWLSLTTAVTYNKLSQTRRENLLITYGVTFERYF